MMVKDGTGSLKKEYIDPTSHIILFSQKAKIKNFKIIQINERALYSTPIIYLRC